MKLKISCENHEKNIQKQSPRGFLTKWQYGILQICSKFTEHSNPLFRFMKTTHMHGCSPVYLLHVCKTPLEDCFWILRSIHVPLNFMVKSEFLYKKGTSVPWKQKFSKSYRRSQEPHLKYRKWVTLLSSRSSPPEQRCSANIKKLSDSALLKPYFCMGVLLWICCIFAEHLFRKTSWGTASVS